MESKAGFFLVAQMHIRLSSNFNFMRSFFCFKSEIVFLYMGMLRRFRILGCLFFSMYTFPK